MTLTLGLAASAVAGRRGWVRSIIIAVAALMCTAVLLAVAAVPAVLAGESDRYLAQQPLKDTGASGPALGYKGVFVNNFGALRVERALVGDASRDAPLPPGIPRVPEPGEVFLSPALSELMVRNKQVRAWFPQEYAGAISPEGLTSADQLLAYIGVPASAFSHDLDDYAVGFGADAPDGSSQAGVRWYQVGGFALLVVLPALAAFVAAARVGSVLRGRRSRALATAGASAATIGVVGATEASVPSLVGGGLGAAVFAWLGPMVTHIPIADRAVTSTDIRVAPLVASAVVIGLAALAGVLSSAAAVRSTRGNRTTRPLIARERVGALATLFLGAGLLLLFACVVRAEPRDPLFRPALILTALGIPNATVLVARLIGGSARPQWRLPVLIAFRRLHRDPGAASALVAVVAVMTFALATAMPVVRDKGESTSWASLVDDGSVGATILVRSWSFTPSIPLEPTVTAPDGADILPTYGLWPPASAPDIAPEALALIATCDQVARLVGQAVDGCSDDAPNLVDRGSDNLAAHDFILRSTRSEEISVPAATHTVEIPDGNAVPLEVAVIISPFNPMVEGRSDLFASSLYARIPSSSEAIEEFRAYAIGAGPGYQVDIPAAESVHVNTLTRWILVGVLLSAGLSAFTALALSITRRRKGSESALAQVAAPGRVRALSSVLSTATTGAVGATVAIAAALVANFAYVRSGEVAMPGAGNYATLWGAAVCAGVMLGALSEALGRLRTE